MADLVLGVVDVPYENAGANADGKRKRGAGASRGEPTTTAKVAQILEDKYGVMQVFYDRHENDIAGALRDSVAGAIEDLLTGAPPRDPYAEADQSVMALFRKFLLSGEIEELGVPGVPTQAAINRRSLRFKGKVSTDTRPSFIDTATYELSFRSWVE